RSLQRPSEILPYEAVVYGSLLNAVLVAVATSFGAAWLLVGITWQRIDARTKLWGLVALATLPTLLIASDWPRLVAPAFVVVAMSAAKSEVSVWGLWGVAGTLALSAVWPDRVTWAVATFVLGAAAVVASRRKSTHDGQPRDRDAGDALNSMPSLVTPTAAGSV